MLKREIGFTLIEILLVITVIAIITVFSINRYDLYKQQVNIAGVKSDVSVILQALHRYYYEQGCKQNGVFAGNANPTIEALGLANSFESRGPIIKQYAAKIVDTGSKTKAGKVINALEITAELNQGYSVSWYEQALAAGASSGSTLSWKTLPNNSTAKPGDLLWVLGGSKQLFRQQETLTDGVVKDAALASNCAG